MEPVDQIRSAPVNSVALHRQSGRVAVAVGDRELVLYRLAGGRLVREDSIALES